MGTYNRILFSHLCGGGIVESVRWQSELCNIHISLVAHFSIWLVAQNFQCPRNFCVLCGSIFIDMQRCNFHWHLVEIIWLSELLQSKHSFVRISGIRQTFFEK